MKNAMLWILTGVIAVGAGAGLFIVADQQGWLKPRSQAAAPEDGAPSSAAPAPGAMSPGVEIVPVLDGPRSQRVPAEGCQVELRMVQFTAPEIAAAAGLTTAVVQAQPVTVSIPCNAEVAFDGRKLAHLTIPAPGVVRRVDRDLGDRVSAGEALAIVDSPLVGDARAERQQALALVDLWEGNLAREQQALDMGAGTKRHHLEAQTNLTEAKISLARAEARLRNFGFKADQIAADPPPEEASFLTVAAPFAGVVVDRHAVIGEVIDESHVLFTIADPSTMWAMLDLSESDAADVRVGQAVTLTVNARRSDSVPGMITWISDQIDPAMRTLKARAEVANPDGALKANMFGRAEITILEAPLTIAVPKSAVQWEGCCNIVFIRHTDMVYQPRKVKLGRDHGDAYLVLEGLEAGEAIVTEGSFLLKTELLRGSIGAGCCENHPAGG